MLADVTCRNGINSDFTSVSKILSRELPDRATRQRRTAEAAGEIGSRFIALLPVDRRAPVLPWPAAGHGHCAGRIQTLDLQRLLAQSELERFGGDGGISQSLEANARAVFLIVLRDSAAHYLPMQFLLVSRCSRIHTHNRCRGSRRQRMTSTASG